MRSDSHFRRAPIPRHSDLVGSQSCPGSQGHGVSDIVPCGSEERPIANYLEIAPLAMEPRGVLARYFPGEEELTVWSSTQIPHLLRTQRVLEAMAK